MLTSLVLPQIFHLASISTKHMKSKTYIILAFSLGLMACEEINPDLKTTDTPVIEAFIFPGQDSISISVKKMISYMASDQDTVQQPITDCQVQLIYHANSIILSHDDDNPGTYFTSIENIQLSPGDTLAFSGTYMNISFSAETLIPSPPPDLSISKDKLYYDVSDPRSMMQAENIILNWSNPELDFYYVFVENLEEDPEPINEMMAEAPKISFAFPSQSDQFQISMRNIRYFGEHRVIVFHVNPEFADLFDNTELTSNAITEPPGNIENAMGIFTALNADTVYFSVTGI